MQREITHFFSVYKQLEGKAVEVDGWRSREEALEVIADGRRLQMEHDAAAAAAKGSLKATSRALRPVYTAALHPT